jgi:hypothetical protein
LLAIVKSMKNKYLLVSALVLACWLSAFVSANAQQKRVLQLSGIVMDTATGPIPGVHIYIPKAGRGTTSNGVGFFSLPVLVGDSVVISSVGYQRRHYIVENSDKEFVTIVVPMVEDVTMLGVIVITPYPTEEVFKEAVLALNLPPDNQIDQKNLNAELLALMLKTTPMDGPLNQRYALNQWVASQNDKFMPVTNPFFNPFNWVKFFNGLKNNKKKK